MNTKHTHKDSKHYRRRILQAITTELRLLALIVLVIEAGFLGGLSLLEPQYRVTAYIANILVVLVLVVGLLLIMIKKARPSGSYLKPKDRKQALQNYHHNLNPILTELRNGLELETATRVRLLVRQCVKMASLAAFGTERPPPDPKSAIHHDQELHCAFCGYSILTDETGSCEDCGLGCRHWLSHSNFNSEREGKENN